MTLQEIIQQKAAAYQPDCIAIRHHLHSHPELSYQEFETSALSQWLEAHSYEYGFILRYPKRMASSTNHVYDAH